MTVPPTVELTRNPHVGLARKTMIALDPAGGCTVRVNIITPTPNPVANPTAHQCGPNNARHTKAIDDAIKCPPTTDRGCDNGASGKANNNSADAPNEPSNISDCVVMDTNASKDTETTAPSVASTIWDFRNGLSIGNQP